MRKSSSQSKTTNTLFNYFNKSIDKSTNGGTDSSVSSVSTNANNSVVATKASSSTSSMHSSTPNIQTDYQLYDLVWAKLEGYPWWPSIVCLHPTTNSYVKRKGKTVFIHVQFFDDPVSRAWIKERDLKEYYGKHKSDVPLLKDPKWNQSIEFADQALKMDVEKRYTLIAALIPSDEEDAIQLIDEDFHSFESPDKSSNQSPNTKKESHKSKSSKKEEKIEHKSDLKRKNSQKEVENKNPKKLKKIDLNFSDNDSNESDDEFKIGSSEDSEESDEELKELTEDSESFEGMESSDSEPKAKKGSKTSSKKSSKSKHKSKSKKKNKTKTKTSSKRSKKSFSSDSDDMSEPSNVYSSDSESNFNVSKGSSKSKKSKKKLDSSDMKSNKSSESDAMFVDSDSDISKTKKVESTPKSSSKNWLTKHITSIKPSEKKNLNIYRNNNNKVNKNLSIANDSFISVKEFGEENNNKEWPHLKFVFLQKEKIKDKNGRFKFINDELNPDYDPTTLAVPESFLNECTPALRQWWHFKSNNFDTILFFKMGKFYELFNMDAVIGVNELQIQYMRGELAHAGFPEKAYKRYADVLIQRNYKVARIEQTETPQMMEERVKKLKKSTKFDKVVKREICRVSSIGTRMASVIDPDSLTDQNSYLLAITENATESSTEFGVCFIDVSIGKFHLSQFKDDRFSSNLRTLIAQSTPSEVLFDRKNMSPKTKQLIENCAPNSRKEIKKEFWSSNKTLKYLTENNLFGQQLPETLVYMLEETDLLHQTSRPEYELAIRSLGAVIEYLIESLIAEEVLTMKLFEEYKPFDNKLSADRLPNNMILDSFTLKNLEVFNNSLGGTEGTLTEVLDFCSTPFGRRLLHKWICAPLCDIQQIQSRQKAVEDLSNVNIRYEVEEAIKALKKLPDLERLLCKIHSQGSAKRARNHPDSRAILFEADVYSKRKICDFLTVLDGFKQSLKIIESFENYIKNFNSPILKKCLTFCSNGGKFPELKGKLNYFDDSFDHKLAKQEGKVIPHTGTDPEYDLQTDKIDSIKRKFDDYLVEQQKFFGSKVNYFGTGKNRFQLEVPDSATKRITKDNTDYVIQSSRKGFKRYSTPYIQKLFEELTSAEDLIEGVLCDTMRRIFETFDKHYNQWSEAIECLSLFDVFLSLSKSRSSLQQKTCVCQPTFSESTKPFINLIESRNPCLLKYCENFIPNDIRIESELLLLTGPNMGGKSTLMRQLGLIVIMAQIGAYVPTLECHLSPVDRIFTRIGAFDRIVEGESTFFVELSETAIILKQSSKHSLVLIDELGRGTSTYDGTAIACAVTKELSENIRCRTLFSSHYHSLVDEFKENEFVKLVHMACIVENENETDPTEESITFLYKLKEDSCPKSYGFNAAQLAGIPKSVIRIAFKKAKQFESLSQIEKTFRNITENKVTENEIKELIPHFNTFSLNN